MNKKIGIPLICWVAATIAQAEEPFNKRNPSPFDREIIKLIRVRSADFSWVTSQNRDAVIARMKLMRSDPGNSNPDATVDIDVALSKLGDEETTARVIGEFIEGGGGLITPHVTEIALPYMVNALYTADTTPRGGGDVFGPSMRGTVLTQFLLSIQRSRLFTDETRQWAWETLYSQHLMPEEEVERRVKLVQQWWEHNEKAVMEKRYRDATWLPVMASQKKPVSMPDPDAARRVMPRGAKANQSDGTNSEAPSIVAAMPKAATSWPILGQYAILAAAVTALSGIVGWFAFRSKRGK